MPEWRQERPTWCPHPTCGFVIRVQDSICGGRLPKPEPHDGDVNTLRLCLQFGEGDVTDMQVNKTDLYHFGRVLAALREAPDA